MGAISISWDIFLNIKTRPKTTSPSIQEALDNLCHRDIEPLFDFLDNTQFWIKDAAGRYLRVNRAFQLNYSLAKITSAEGLTDFDLSPPWLAESFLADDADVLKGKRIVNRVELVGGFATGSAQWFRTSKIPVSNRDGVIAATTGVTSPLPELQAPDFPVPDLAPALSALEKQPEIAWRNADLAGLSNLSVSTFERRFRLHLHTSPSQFLKRLRLARASASLLQTHVPVSTIALQWGFSDQAHFSREFKKMTGMSPSIWRARHLG